MENIGEWEQKNLKNELLRGKELARQLQIYLNVRQSSSMAASSSSSSSSSSSNGGGELLVKKILSSYEKALSLLSSSTGIQISESPSTLNGSPRSEDSDHDQRNASRKRNILPTWTQKFQVSPGMALEGSLDDGFCWRKYGQKGILGAKHPRGYYRCTHRNVQGCLATKQVQRCDDDPTVFEITYRGNHTCSQVSNLTPPSATPDQFQQPNSSIDSLVQSHPPDQNQQTSPPDALLNSWASLKVITENLDTTHEPTFPPFSYDPTSNYEAANHVKSASTVDVNFAEFSPSFISPTTTTSGSGLRYFPASSSVLSEGFVGHQNLQANKPELSEIFSSPTSAVNSQTLGLEFPFGEVELMEPSFTFHNTNFFS
uniref:WRKY transcription factor 13 n=1 Tax=Siraitia grosvenorii TaxID=190515 RepID=A0A3T0I8G0_SIRGR|nr:WRKY transcription factor 13 [Siraitia grosvenorii]QEE82235.1 WRKY transcription factor 13 [Siraitia grosvenorii]